MDHIKKTFIKNLEIENKLISKISFTDLLNVDINIPSVQRLYHKEKIDQIVQYPINLLTRYHIKND